MERPKRKFLVELPDETVELECDYVYPKLKQMEPNNIPVPPAYDAGGQGIKALGVPYETVEPSDVIDFENQSEIFQRLVQEGRMPTLKALLEALWKAKQDQDKA